MSAIIELDKELEPEIIEKKVLNNSENSNYLLKVQALFKAYYANKFFSLLKTKTSIPNTELFTVFSSFKNYFSNYLRSETLDYLEKFGMYFKPEILTDKSWAGPLTTDFTHFYYGETDEKKVPYGSGVLISFNYIYEGWFSNGKFEGKGRMIDDKQGVYDGDWQSGQKHGNGTMTYWNCSKYSGNWEDNKKHGQGALDEQSSHYEGCFENDLKCGYGEQTFKNGTWYKGNFVNGLYDGIGTLNNKQSNESYEGEFNCGSFDGKGTLIMPDGWTYVGDFKNGNRSGFGTLKSSEVRYESKWINDEPFGEYNKYSSKQYVIKGVWKKFLPVNHMDEVIQNIFLGNFLAATNGKWLREIGIKYIIRVLDDEKVELLPGFIYFYIKAKDTKTQNIKKYLPGALDFIDDLIKKNEKVLVHCYAGISRSPSIVIALIMRNFRKTFDEAYEYLKERRPCIRPNKGFIKQLKELKFKKKS
ncbi:unnamed protein product [Blepharisma stoltei]|uniref:protein-tyrosine-phosphatase n=1 Tax=Blepharisma stoltei TaxID=1481888 RepID=A0AAU9KAT2_9CILI|nr:unnamed protein product [Blepharisma stoltei]